LLPPPPTNQLQLTTAVKIITITKHSTDIYKWKINSKNFYPLSDFPKYAYMIRSKQKETGNKILNVYCFLKYAIFNSLQETQLSLKMKFVSF